MYCRLKIFADVYVLHTGIMDNFINVCVYFLKSEGVNVHIRSRATFLPLST